MAPTRGSSPLPTAWDKRTSPHPGETVSVEVALQQLLNKSLGCPRKAFRLYETAQQEAEKHARSA